MSPKHFAAIVGAAMALGALIALLVPVSITTTADGDEVRCGTGLIGINERDIDAADIAEAGRDIAGAMYGYADEGDPDILGMCEDRISTQRMWGFPIGGLGLVVLAGAAAIRTGQTSSSTPPAGSAGPTGPAGPPSDPIRDGS